MSVIRKRYFARLVFRVIVFLICFCFCLIRPADFGILEGFQFFREFSLLHLLWLIWMLDMIQQIIPLKNKLPLGSMKLFANRFRPIRDRFNPAALREHIRTTTISAYKVMLLWLALLAVIATLYFTGVIGKLALFLISVAFYVCDLICVLIWCPFRLIMKNRCCTTCRIFNWDHFMMFSPIVFMGGFFALSLFAMSLVAWIVWELCVMLYPERFWEHSNTALKCSECTDKLCTQYCRKLRK